MGSPVARCELLDALTIKAVNRYSKLTLREVPMLLCEFHGTQASVEEQAKSVQAIAAEHGGLDFEWATRQEERTRLWQARHDAYLACMQLRPGNRGVATDVCVPVSRLAECIAATNEDIAKASMPIALFGHVGDGNFHLVILVDATNQHDLNEADAINGLGKLDFLDAEHGSAVAVMRSIKHALDPQNLFNPGKLIRV
jgi:D-lactate dehydrogenase (cytochrome)